MSKGMRQPNQTKSAASEAKWRNKVNKYERLSVTICRIRGFSIKTIAQKDIRLARNERLTIKTNTPGVSREYLHLELKGKDYEARGTGE